MSKITKPIRSNLLPANVVDFEGLDPLVMMRDFLWNTWLTIPRTNNEIGFSFYFSLMIDGGAQLAFLDTLPTLVFDPDFNTNQVKIKTDPSDKREAHSPLSLPVTASLLFHTLRNRCNTTTHDLKDVLHATSKGELDKRWFKNQYKIFAHDFQTHTKKSAPSWKVFTHINHLIAWQAGLDPWVLTLLSRLPFPRAPFEGSVPLQTDVHHGPAMMLNTTIPPQNVKTCQTNPLEQTATPNKTWQDQAREIIDTLLDDLDFLDVNKKKHFTDLVLMDALHVFTQARAKANDLAPGTSGLHLVLNWLESKLVKRTGKLTVKSMRDYVSRTVTSSLLTDKTDSWDMRTWVEDDLIALVEERIDQEGLKDGTVNQILTTYDQLLRFGSKNGYHEAVNISDYFNEGVVNAARAHLVGLNEFETVLSILFESQDEDSLAIAAAAAMIFYGTLRPNELARLTVNEIVYDDHVMDLEIVTGKTEAARRRIPFSVLASPLALDIVKQHIKNRSIRFTGQPIKTIPVFGNRANTDALTAKEMSEKIMAKLRPYFGPGFITYHLRHAAISWIFLRWFVLRHPSCLEQLHDRHAEVFQHDHQQRLANYLTNYQSEKIDPSSTTDLFKLAKIFGHLSPLTSFTYYIHTFSFVQDFLMQQHNQQLGTQTLKGKVISQLVPKLKSRTTQATLPDKTLHTIMTKCYQMITCT